MPKMKNCLLITIIKISLTHLSNCSYFSNFFCFYLFIYSKSVEKNIKNKINIFFPKKVLNLYGFITPEGFLTHR